MSKSLLITAEAIVTGLVFLAAAFFVIDGDIGRIRLVPGLFLPVLAAGFFVGYFLSVVAEWLTEPWTRRAARAEFERQRTRPFALPSKLAELRASASPGERDEIDRHEAALRVSRHVAICSLLLLVLALFKGRPTLVWLLAPMTAVAAAATRAEVGRLVANLLRERKAGTGRPPLATPSIPASPPVTQLADGVSTRVLVFAGGTAFRNSNIALARRGHRVTRIVPSWDNGGSSRPLREAFQVQSIGDIRQALMTMAHGENNSNEVIRLFNWRLSEDGDDGRLLAEMESFLKEEHPRIAKVPTDLRNVILRYLETFWTARPDSLPLRNGSIGNFVMLGAFLAHGRDINTAIYVFRQLCGIRGHVWPVSLLGDLHLCARLENDRVIVGEEQITDIERPAIEDRIATTFLIRGKDPDQPPAVATANPLVLSAFEDADVIVFGPGSFFTSVLPHLRVAGVADALAASDKPKLFIGNMREGNECFGWSLAQLVAKFLDACHRNASKPREATRYLTHIIAHDTTTHHRGVRGDHYMEVGEIEPFRRDGIEIWFGDLEDPWKRGHHDGNALAQRIITEARV